MKSINFKKISSVNLIIIGLIVMIGFNVLFSAISFTKEIIHPTRQFDNLSFGGIDIPVMRPYKDVFFYIKSEEIKKDPTLEQRLQRNEYIFHSIFGLLQAPITILLFFQLIRLINSIKKRDLHNRRNSVYVKNIAYLICLAVFIEFLKYQLLQLAVPLDLIRERINYITLKEDLFSSLRHSISLNWLIIAFVFYSLSVVFKDAFELKEQSELTI